VTSNMLVIAAVAGWFIWCVYQGYIAPVPVPQKRASSATRELERSIESNLVGDLVLGFFNVVFSLVALGCCLLMAAAPIVLALFIYRWLTH